MCAAHCQVKTGVRGVIDLYVVKLKNEAFWVVKNMMTSRKIASLYCESNVVVYKTSLSLQKHQDTITLGRNIEKIDSLE